MVEYVSHALDSFFGLLTKDQWDAWRSSIVACGGLVALFIALATYVRNAKLRREEQARLVYSRPISVKFLRAGSEFTFGGGVAHGNFETTYRPDASGSSLVWLTTLDPSIQLTAVIHNGSKELIGPVRVAVVNSDGSKTPKSLMVDIAAIEPESDHETTITWANETELDRPSLGTTVEFRDASGAWWRRALLNPIQRIRVDSARMARRGSPAEPSMIRPRPKE
jgi:hypothetical protein